MSFYARHELLYDALQWLYTRNSLRNPPIYFFFYFYYLDDRDLLVNLHLATYTCSFFFLRAKELFTLNINILTMALGLVFLLQFFRWETLRRKSHQIHNWWGWTTCWSPKESLDLKKVEALVLLLRHRLLQLLDQLANLTMLSSIRITAPNSLRSDRSTTKSSRNTNRWDANVCVTHAMEFFFSFSDMMPIAWWYTQCNTADELWRMRANFMFYIFFAHARYRVNLKLARCAFTLAQIQYRNAATSFSDYAKSRGYTYSIYGIHCSIARNFILLLRYIS